MGITYNPRTVTDGLVLALDAGNTKSFSPNVFPRGTDIYGWYVDTRGNANALRSTISRDTISSPVGNTPLKMQVTGNDPYLDSYNSTIWNLAAASSGDTWTVSFYVKASQNTTGEILLFESNGTTYYSVPNTTYNITTSWQRVSFTTTFSNANTTVIQLRLDGPNSGGSGTTVWWDGLQLERGSTASEFTKNYTLDSSLNYRTLDLTRNGNNGTLTNMDGGNLNTSNGGSLTFDGTNDYISAGALSGSFTSFTVIVWFYPTSVTSYENSIDCNYSYNGTTGNIGPRLEMNNSGRLGWIYSNITNSNDSYYNHVVVSSGLAANTWHCAAITYNGGTSTSTTYYNGNASGLSRSTIGSPTGFVGVMNNVTIGKGFHLGGSERIFTGRVSNVSIYNKTLSAAEVKQNFNALRGRYGI